MGGYGIYIIFITPQYPRKIKYSLELPPEHRIVESHILCICPSEVVEARRHVDTDISPVPWLDLVPIYRFTFLITLCPAVEVRVRLEPGDISLVAWIGLELLLSARIEEVDREAELMLAVPWRCTEGVRASSEVPESLLIRSTAVATHDDEWFTELFLERLSECPECITCILAELTIASGLVDIGSR